jgi:hypothetical protein
MARIPDVLSLGGVNAGGERRTGGWDISPLARGGQALARGVEQLGAGIGEAGAGLGEYTLGKARYETAIAHTQAEAETTVLKAQLADPSDTDYATKVQRFQDGAQQINDKWAQTISLPALAGRFTSDRAAATAVGTAAIEAHARAGYNGFANAQRTGPQQNAVINAALVEDDGNKRAQMLRQQAAATDQALAAGMITPAKAEREKRLFVHQYGTAYYMKKADTDPAAVLSEFEGAPGSGSEITNRILEVEGHDKARASSADGYGQFVKSTWLDTLRRYKPELAAGRSDAELLALRGDRALGREMTDRLRQENVGALQAAGVSTEPGYQYLAHFLGPKGAIAVAKADPNTPVAAALSRELGPDTARRMIAANPTILAGATAGSVAQWAHGKMGGSEVSRFMQERMDPDTREQLLERARANLQKTDAKGEADFTLRYQDTVAQAFAGQTPAQPLTVGDFIAKRGAELGPRLYDDYQAQLQLGRDRQAVAVSSPAEIAALREKYRPPEGGSGEGFAAATKRQDVINQAIAEVEKDKASDPAGFAISRLPAVAEAKQKLDAVMADKTADPAEAVKQFVAITRAEQQRVGIPSEAVRILPKSTIDQIVAEIEKPAPGKDPTQLVPRIQQQARLWGDAWPEITREMKGATPLVSVLGDGVKPSAAARLVDAAKMTFKDIVQDEHAAKAMDIQNAVNDAMVPFGRSMLANQGGMRVYNNFRGQVEKLAALYVFQDSMTAADAARKATDDVIDHRYEYRDGFRIPAKEHPQAVPYGADDLQVGAAVAKSRLGDRIAGVDLAVTPAIDTFGGVYSAKQLAEQTAQAKRDGKWTTADDEKGVWLTYNGGVVRRSDGLPLKLTWDQLAGIAKDYKSPTGPTSPMTEAMP